MEKKNKTSKHQNIKEPSLLGTGIVG